MPSALLQPFFNSCLVSSSRLYFEVVRSYPRRGKALHLPPFLLVSYTCVLLPVLDYSLNLGTVTISALLSSGRAFSSLSFYRYPGRLHFQSPPPHICALSGPACGHSRLHSPFKLDAISHCCTRTSTATEFTVPPVPHHFNPLPLPKKIGGEYCQSFRFFPSPGPVPLAPHTARTHTSKAGTDAHSQPEYLIPAPLCLSGPPSRGDVRCMGPPGSPPGM